MGDPPGATIKQVASVFQALGAKTPAQAVGLREEAFSSDRTGCEDLATPQVMATALRTVASIKRSAEARQSLKANLFPDNDDENYDYDGELFGREGYGHGKGLPPGLDVGKGGKGDKGDEEKGSNVGSQGSQQNIITNHYYGSGGNSEIDKKRDAKLLELMGNDGSALELAKQMSESRGADIAQLKIDAGLENFPTETNCQDDLWNLLWAETVKAGEHNGQRCVGQAVCAWMHSGVPCRSPSTSSSPLFSSHLVYMLICKGHAVHA